MELQIAQRLDCLLNRFLLAYQRIHQSSVSLAFFEGNAPGGLSLQKASNAENISIKWLHHVWNEIDGIVNVSSQVAEI